jgi:hypothetical protein
VKTPGEAARHYWARQVGYTDAKVDALADAIEARDKEHAAMLAKVQRECENHPGHDCIGERRGGRR